MTYHISAGTVTLTVDAAILPDPATMTLPPARVGIAYSHQFKLLNATGVWTVKAGTVPAGLTLATDGTLAGTPTEVGAFSFDLDAAVGA